MATTPKKQAPSLPFVDVETTTKINKDDKSPVTTKLRIIFDDEAAAKKFAARGGAIAWQAMQRAAGIIPTEAEVNLSDLAKRQGGGFKATPDSLANRIGKMSSDDYRATLEKLELPKATIDAMCKKYDAKQK